MGETLTNEENILSIKHLTFIAEEELIEIIPRFQAPRLNFLCGEFGPFSAQTPITVPLWLAIALKKQRKCNIKSPPWMTKENLEEIYRIEKEGSVNNLSEINFNYLETSHLLLEHATDDLDEPERIRTLIEDIRSVRDCKIRQGLHSVGNLQTQGGAVTFIKLNNAAAVEIHEVRPILLATLEEFRNPHEQYPN